MHNFKTIMEKASEWDISSRHIQYLCRCGKIEGAVKRAGTWFIPNDTPSPAKNTKSDAEGFEFVGTKKRIFESAIKLFLMHGFDNVSLRDIGASVGIRQSTIYNHFESKREILDTIYNFHSYHYLANRPSLKDMEAKLRAESLIEIIGSLRYDFKEEHLEKMSDITKIVLQRISIDERARKIAKTLILDEGMGFVEAVFNKAVEIGRMPPFDVHSMAVFINSVRIYTFFHWLLDSSIENMSGVGADERTLYEVAARFLSDQTQTAYALANPYLP